MQRQQFRLVNVFDVGEGGRTINRQVLLWILFVGVFLALFGTVQQSGASTAVDAKVYLPVVMANYQGTQPSEGIKGQVTAKGVPVEGASLDLRLWDDNDEETVATTTTDANGNYLFTGINTPGPGEGYYVRYGPNNSDPSLVSWWFGPDINNYTSGMLVDGGDLDLADADLENPDDGATESLPVTFEWDRRALPGDSYRVILYDPNSGDSWSTNDLGDTGSFTANNLPPDIESGKPYRWYIEIFNGPGNSYGESFDTRELTFSFSSNLLHPPDEGGMSAFKERARQAGK